MNFFVKIKQVQNLQSNNQNKIRQIMKHQGKSTEDYFQNLLKKLQNYNHENGFEDSSYHQTCQISTKCIEQTAFDIIAGQIQVKHQPDKISSLIKVPSNKKNDDEINQIDQKIKENQQMLKQAKRDLLIHQRNQKQAIKLQNQIKKSQNLIKIKAWSQKQKQLNEKRREFYQKRNQEIQQQQQQQKIQRQRRQEQQLERRRKSLQNRLQQMQQERSRRQQLFQQSIEDTKKIKLPKFKVIQKQFEKALQEQKFEKDIIKKNIKLASLLNHNLIKQHEKNYMERIVQRMKSKSYSSQKNMNQQQKLLAQSRFNNFVRRTDDQIRAQRERFIRRINFQQKLNQLEVKVDQDKRMKVLIALDKAKNPFKYNFLRQKQLNDYQIYMEFKDFAIDIDRAQLGNNYLEESKKIGEESRIKKSHSVSAISLKNNQQKQTKYKNYLLQLKANRSVYNMDKNSTQTILHQLKKETSQQKAIERISRNLKKFDHQIRDKKYQLQTFNSIQTTMKKQRQIDQMYMKSIKAKLACLQIQ